MKKLLLIPLFVFGIVSSLAAQTITSFYGTSTAFVPNLYNEIQGYTLTWQDRVMPGTDVETYSDAFVTRGYDKINFSFNYGDTGTNTAIGTATIYGKVGGIGNWISIVNISVSGTGTDYVPISEGWTNMRIGLLGTGTIDVDADVFTKKR